MLGWGILKGMFTTLAHVFMPPVTVQYPEQRPDLPPWTRGRPRLIYNLDTGDLRCVSCRACALACPVDVIKIEDHRGAGGKKVLDRFDIDMGGCIECALCVEACPFRAIVMAPDFEFGTYDRQESLVFNMYQLRIAGTPEVDHAMEFIQGVKRGLAAQAARGEAPGGRAPAAVGAAPAAAPKPAAPAAATAKPAGGKGIPWKGKAAAQGGSLAAKTGAGAPAAPAATPAQAAAPAPATAKPAGAGGGSKGIPWKGKAAERGGSIAATGGDAGADNQ